MRILGSYEPGEKLVLDIMRDKRRSTIEVEVPDDRTSRHLPRQLQPAPLEIPPLPSLVPLPATVPSLAPVPAARPGSTNRT
jgi:hypothetical protein